MIQDMGKKTHLFDFRNKSRNAKILKSKPPSCEEEKQAKNLKWKYLSKPGIEPTTQSLSNLAP